MARPDVFRQALSALQTGEARKAERLFKELIYAEPKHVAALNLLAVLLTKLEKYSEAEIYIRRALNESAKSDASFYNYGIILKALGRPSEALGQFDQALEINPSIAETWMNRGTVFRDLHRYDDAIADFDKAISLQTNYAEAFCNKGNVYTDLKQYDKAFAAYDRALSLKPELADAWLGRGNALTPLKQYDKAFAAYDRALSLKPGFAEAWLGRGTVHAVLEQYDKAFAAYDHALSLKPELADAWLGRGNVYVQLKQYDNAFAAYDQALRLRPEMTDAWLGRGDVHTLLRQYDNAFAAYDRALSLKSDLAEAWLGRGNVHALLKQNDMAFAAYDRALSLNSDLAEAWLGRGNVYALLKQYDKAFAAYGRALSLKSDLAEAWLGRANIYTQLKQYEDAVAAYDHVLRLNPDLKYAEGLRLYAKMQLCDWTNITAYVQHFLGDQKLPTEPFVLLPIGSSSADQLQCAKAFVADQGSFPVLSHGQIYSHDRIRIAYLSADLHEHATAYLIAGLFEQHDKSKFETTAISFAPNQNSDMRRRIISAFEHFIDVENKSDQEIADLIRQREIDIAIDLMGFTQGARYNALARRPAPIQVNYLGYPGTMGADYIDYILADPTVIPEEHFSYYSESVVWLPESYQVNDWRRHISEQGPSRRECALPDTAFVLCCFNSPYKILPDTFDIWMRLLRANENSVLWLIEGHAAACDNLRSEAEKRGVSAKRLIFASRMPLSDHLARHRHADLFLDTLPYNAHTTASDALWAGVPVLTCLGSTFAGRVGASLLKAIGLDELITHSPRDYETLALRLAHDRSYLVSLRDRLRRNRDTYPLFDTKRFARHLEAAYLTMWDRHQKGEAPGAFAVAPQAN